MQWTQVSDLSDKSPDINLNSMKGVPIISNIKRKSHCMGSLKGCIVQYFEVVLCCKEHDCFRFQRYKAYLTPVYHTDGLTAETNGQWCSFKTAEPCNTNRKEASTLVAVKDTSPSNWVKNSLKVRLFQAIWWDFSLKFSFPVLSLTTFLVISRSLLKLLHLCFAVNIETNGNPHHHHWSIGKRLLSSWLPVRSAKDQGGQRSHTHCKVKAKAKRDRQSS